MDKKIEVKNIDSFQGREKEIIVVSLVRTGRKLGFITSGQRLNVALTRARRGLVVMGNFFSLYNGQDSEGYLWEFVHHMYQNKNLVKHTRYGFETWAPKESYLRRDPPTPRPSEKTKKKHTIKTNIAWTIKDDVNSKDTSSGEKKIAE